MTASFDFEAPLWESTASWYFLTVPIDASDEIAARMDGFSRGFGSVRVRVRIGGSEWATSVFPDSKRGAYILPVKKAVRVAEGLSAGVVARVHLELVELRP